MERFRILPAVLVLAAIALLRAPAAAQDQDSSTPQPRHVRQPAQHPVPFSLGNDTPQFVTPVEFRSLDRMTPQDRDLATGAESAINEKAGVGGLEFNQGSWNYQQIACSALPSHLFLRFTRNNGASDVSVFSASIPRSGDGRVRVIPILRRGYSLFSSAPVNALTISAFNHIRAEEHPASAPEWLATGLCYAALAGAHPQIGPPDDSEIKKLPATPTGTLVMSPGGGGVILFTDVSATPRPMQWTMTFDGKGKLLKATHTAAPKSRENAVQRTQVEVQGQIVQQRH
jgi:hypothetical protein